MINADAITSLQQCTIREWHIQLSVKKIDAPLLFVQENNYWNFLLWHEEDIARIRDIEPLRIVEAKRNIDVYNQSRNDAMEKIDEWIFMHLDMNNKEAPLHSETPGMMIDRLSIMQLKLYHTNEETLRQDVDEAHLAKCTNRVLVLQQQIKDLSYCLKKILEDLQAGRLQFKVYRQLKMYNDPSLNPQLYKKHESAG